MGGGCLRAVEYAKLLKELWACRDAVVNPLRFKAALCSFAPQFTGHSQHDSQELLAFLLDGLHEDLNVAAGRKRTDAGVGLVSGDTAALAAAAWAAHLTRNNSAIVRMFQGQLLSTIQCTQPKCMKVCCVFVCCFVIG